MTSQSAPQPVGPARPKGGDPRDRFLTFAFAAADLLLEVNAAGTVTFAAGAFRHYLGKVPEAFIGCPLADIIAPGERGALAIALQILSARGRLPPTATRLNDARGTAFCLAGLAPSVAEGRFFLTLGPLPAPPQAVTVMAEDAFGRAAAGAMSRAGGALTLIDLPEPARAAVSQRPGLEEELNVAVLAGSDGLAGRIAPGRYGILSGAESDLPSLAARMEAVLLAHDLPGGVETRGVPLEVGALTPAQATRALRQALGSFAAGGTAGLAEGGLTGALRQIAAQAGRVRRAITERRFKLLYQPIVDLRTRHVHHHEALLRPEGLGVEAFIRCAETIGLTEELDLAVVDHVLDALRFSPSASVAINISGLSMQSASFRDALGQRLDAHARLAPRLLVELTESAEIEDDAAARATLEMLRERGIALCIDDFGAGAAAFRYLRNFRVDWVKVDGAYVQNAVRAERDRSFVASMVDLSLAVGARVIAEQVETEAHAEVMRGLGIEMAQGYLFARPGPLPGAGRTVRIGT